MILPLLILVSTSAHSELSIVEKEPKNWITLNTCNCTCKPEINLTQPVKKTRQINPKGRLSLDEEL